ncbi:MAG TPA: putative lipid II flippase FtsW [Oscillospiraceae bacterium]|nr:putative lipid II flippase FtsW [Oscillospiraceae bacterium]HPS35410.1 putative lipid II flippase FtsW [Oscillospiraceae bacterium]
MQGTGQKMPTGHPPSVRTPSVRGNLRAIEAQKKKSIFYGIAARGYFDLPFFFLVIILLAFGLVMLYSASNVYALQHEGDSAFYVVRQLRFALIGVICMVLISYINYNALKRFAWIFYLAGLVLLVVVLFMPLRNGARRWIYIGSFNFQPSELMKFFIIVLFAKLISDFSEKTDFERRMRSFKNGVLPFLILLVPVVLLMYKEPHMSGIVLFVSITAVMMWVGGTHWAYFVGIFGAIAVGLAAIVLSGNIQYMLDRVSYWLDPWSDPLDKGYQTIQSLYAIGSGGLWGVGLGNSRQKHLYIPEPQNDFIYAVICEELGFIGAVVLILLFVWLLWRGFKIAFRARDKFGAMLAVGLSVQVGLQALLNIAVVTNTIPNTGISLPFFSSGGTSLMMLLAEMGVVLSVSRSTTIDNAL